MLPIPALQGALASLSHRVAASQAVLECHPLITGLQFHGLILLALLGTLWLLSGYVRLRELRRRRQRRGALARLSAGAGGRWGKADEQEAAERLPAVTVVLPVRGCRSHSLDNWRSMLALEYGGPLEYTFVLEDKADPAHGVVSLLAREAKGGGRPVTVICAGQAQRTSQKIHNLMAGIRAASPDAAYVLCLDDDVQLHPGLLEALVRDMEGDPSLPMATGYPFDVPDPHANLLSYCALSYHLPLLVAFSIRQRIDFVWGGCMLFRAADLRSDRHGVLAAWADGGYSDDLTVASKCTEQRLRILCPSYAIFPQWLEGSWTLRRWWNYLRRQLVVLDTYSNEHNRRTNHTMAVAHCWASLGVVLPLTTVSLRLLLWALAVLLLPTQQVYGGPQASSYLWLRLFGMAGCPWGLASWAAFAAFFAFAVLALRWMTGVILDLFCELNPALDRRQLSTFHWLRCWLGFYISNAAIPLCITYTFATSHVDWSGTRYWRQGGKVVRVQHHPGT